jgi:rhamnosyltransferase
MEGHMRVNEATGTPECHEEAASRISTTKVALHIPIRNAARFAARQISAIECQTIRADRSIVIDSESSDGSPEFFREAGFEVVRIGQQTFDHGGTRNLGMSLAPEANIHVFLTQDAIPYGERCFEALVQRFEDPLVAVSYGRQLPRDNAGPVERHARLFNYTEANMTRSLPSAAALGIKAIFNSNSFAAYRREALDVVGGFPARTIMGEDQISAGRLLLAGWSIAYAGDAAVIHSHGYGLREEFRRYFDIGVFHQRNRDLLSNFGSAGSEGLRFIRSELGYLLRHAPAHIPEAWARTVFKFIGYRLGRCEAVLPRLLKMRLAMQSKYFAISSATGQSMKEAAEYAP